jgi:hypothetical protein
VPDAFEGRDAFAVAEGVDEQRFLHEALVGEVEAVAGVLDLNGFFGHGGADESGVQGEECLLGVFFLFGFVERCFVRGMEPAEIPGRWCGDVQVPFFLNFDLALLENKVFVDHVSWLTGQVSFFKFPGNDKTFLRGLFGNLCLKCKNTPRSNASSQ